MTRGKRGGCLVKGVAEVGVWVDFVGVPTSPGVSEGNDNPGG